MYKKGYMKKLNRNMIVLTINKKALEYQRPNKRVKFEIYRSQCPVAKILVYIMVNAFHLKQKGVGKSNAPKME